MNSTKNPPVKIRIQRILVVDGWWCKGAVNEACNEGVADYKGKAGVNFYQELGFRKTMQPPKKLFGHF